MGAALAVDARTETYHDLKDMIFDICHNFCRRYSVDFEDVISLANEAFCESFQTFDRSRASFITHVNIRVRSKIWEWHRRGYCKQNLMAQHNQDMDLSPSPYEFNLTDFVDTLSEDARTMIRLTFRGPRDVGFHVAERGDDSPRNLLRAIKEVLRDLGWDSQRIGESILEIRRALA